MNAFERDLKNCLLINCGSVIPVYLSEKKIVDVNEAESEGATIKYTLFATVMLRRACCGRGFLIVVKFWAQLFLTQWWMILFFEWSKRKLFDHVDIASKRLSTS